MELAGCEMLRDVTCGCRAVLLAATEAEAEPLRAALLGPEIHVLATKTILVGELALAGGSGRPCAPGRPEPPLAGSPGAAGGAARTVPVVVAISGCDKANVAHVLACLLQAMKPAPVLVLQAGIAGALLVGGPGPSAALGDLVLATQEAYSDTGSSSPDGWLSAADLGLPIARVDGVELGGAFPVDAALVEAAAEIVEAIDWPGARPAVLLGPCVTTSRVTGRRMEAEETGRRWGALAESMEGAAAAHVCAFYRVPFLEIRGISNLVGGRDRGAWQADRAVAVAGRAALAVVAALERLPVEHGGTD